MYESPITKIYGQIQNEIIKQDEERLMCSVNQSVGYQVDKDELIKALQYDRNQYCKGYNDALARIKAEIDLAMNYQYAIGDNDYAEGFEKSIEIIDKYKQEEKNV